MSLSCLIGHAQDEGGGTGCTVLLFPEGATASCDVRGGAPGGRETALLDPACSVERIDALLFTGGSAFGLDAASGVVAFCEERGWGFDVGVGVVPIVSGACIFDLSVGNPRSRPDRAMGLAACNAAKLWSESPLGNVGVGSGASVGKYLGPEGAMKGGFGWARADVGDVTVLAVAAVNPLGAVREESGAFLAGAVRNGTILSPLEALRGGVRGEDELWGRNTTLAAVVTNARLSKSECRRVAIMGHDGLAAAIFPVHTPFDGDTVFCVSVGTVAGDPLLVGTVGTSLVAEAIRRGVREAVGAYGLSAAREIAGGCV
ncbi:P1 family peptidase [Aminiphilus circumscriptus]|uniref:P1 family peptidase n=1 Tax=Aminiphilus circumscriptus TaxID=290732 RepID=UPI00049296E6|nr:P1 family peptidase [Aminiphilus circumscriptus]